MALILRLPGHHTTRQFRAAARQRFAEAKRADMAGDGLIGIYLCGYAAEMLLKAAYFRLAGKKPSDPITMSDLRNAKGYANTKLGIGWSGNLHDLRGWSGLLVEERKVRGAPYLPSFSTGLNQRITNLHSNWREDLRYSTNRPRHGEVSATVQAVAWLMVNYPGL